MADEVRTAMEIASEIEVRYAALPEERVDPRTKRGIGRFFEKLFQGPQSMEPEPIHAAFLEDVQALSLLLAGALEKEGEAARSEAALFTAGIMLRPKPVEGKAQAQWYMVGAEYGFAALIPLVPAKTLAAIRDAYLRGTPKRSMYPRQRALLKLMERALAGENHN